MNKQEFMQAYNLLDAVYELNFENKKLDAWYEALKTMNHEKLMMAAQRYIETEKFKPKPADLIKLSAEMRPSVKNRDNFKCELCKGGFVGVEHEVGKEKVVYYYRCKCPDGLSCADKIPIITDDILNSRYRDMAGVYRLEASSRTEVKREDFRRTAQGIGRW
jgi:hypothetical protein